MVAGMGASAGSSLLGANPIHSVEIGLATIGGATAVPYLLARYLTRPKALETLDNILRVQGAKATRQEIISRFMGIVLAEKAKDTNRGLIERGPEAQAMEAREQQRRERPIVGQADKFAGLLNGRQ